MNQFSHSTKQIGNHRRGAGFQANAPQMLCGIADQTGRNQPHTSALVADFFGAQGMHPLKTFRRMCVGMN